MTFFHQSPKLAEQAKSILQSTWEEFPTLGKNQIALTWMVDDNPVRSFSYRGRELIYPASVVKLFYLVAIHQWLESGKIIASAELDRAIHDAITISSNDATSLIVDMLTETTSGPELAPDAFQTWQYQRNMVNRYFQSLGWAELDGINVNQKTWGDGYYGRERAFVGSDGSNRNMLTTDGVARLLYSIVRRVAVSGKRSQEMMSLLRRHLTPEDLAGKGSEEKQISGFLGQGLPKVAKLWSKAGWTSQVRHDAAYIEIPQVPSYLLVVFTEGKENSQNPALLPFLGKAFAAVMDNLGHNRE